MVRRLLTVSGAGPGSRVLSLGCGIGDTELLLAPHVGSVTGIDLSPSAIRQARADASAAGIRNAEFIEGAFEHLDGAFDFAFGVFFLHHLPDASLDAFPERIASLLAPGGVFYSLDPSRWRLAGALGRLIVPGLMRRYQTPDERELDPWTTAARFEAAGFASRVAFYDFFSSQFAGLLPGFESGYRMARAADEVLCRIPLLSRLGGNFEVIARLSAAPPEQNCSTPRVS
ncbi:MAG: methyltransferase domain-containing protein [Bryobacterales bacterium]|nr:methyltransferase domain-containing protein [Bryobacterales bacterium]